MDSANNPSTQVGDQAHGTLDDLLAAVRFDDSPAPQKRRRKKKEAPAKDFKALLWASADKLRAQMDAAEYKHLVLGLISLKYVSDTFVEQRQEVLATVSGPESDYYLGDDPADHLGALEGRGYYTRENVFWVPCRCPLGIPKEPGEAARHLATDRPSTGCHREREPPHTSGKVGQVV